MISNSLFIPHKDSTYTHFTKLLVHISLLKNLDNKIKENLKYFNEYFLLCHAL